MRRDLFGLALNLLLSFSCVTVSLSFQRETLFAARSLRRPNGVTVNVGKAESMTEEEKEVAMEKATKAMTAFTNKYLQNTSTKLCVDKSVPAVVIKGLAEHKVNLGAPLCPCRFYDDKEKEAKDGYWNCPCVPMRERHECHCMLFLTDDNDFAGKENDITYEEVLKLASGMEG
jgi:ferredoxin-thioredoxin reductase catalytic subunit